MKEMTNKEYVAKKGLSCPYCHERTAEAVGDLEIDGPVAWLEVACNSSTCGQIWTDEYNLVGWTPKP